MAQKTRQVIENVQAQHFDAKTQAKALNALNKILPDVTNPLSETEALNREHLCVMDGASLCMIIARTTEARLLLKQFIDKDGDVVKMPKLDYKYGGSGKYNIEHVTHLINVLKCVGETVTVSTAKEYPLTLENEHFRVIIASQVGEYGE